MSRQYQIGPCWHIPTDGAAGEAPRWIRVVVTELEDESVSYVVDEAVSPNKWERLNSNPSDSSTWLVWRPTDLERGNQASGRWERYFTRQMKDGSQRYFFSQSPTRLGSVLTERLKFDQANSEQYTRHPARLRCPDLSWPEEHPAILWPDSSFPSHLIWGVEQNIPAQDRLAEEATKLTKFQQSQVFALFKFLLSELKTASPDRATYVEILSSVIRGDIGSRASDFLIELWGAGWAIRTHLWATELIKTVGSGIFYGEGCNKEVVLDDSYQFLIQLLQKELSKYAPGLEVHAPPMLQALRGKKMGARLELRVETDIAIILSEVSSGRLTPANKNLLVELVCREADGEAVFDVDDKSAFRDVAGYLLEVLNVLKEKTADNLGLRTCIRRILPDDEAEAKRKLEIYVIKHLWRILLFVETQEPENIVKTLAEVGVDIHARDEQNKTILHWASIEGRAVAVYALSSEGIDVNAHDNSDHTALHYAVIGGHVDVLSELIKVVGINVNTQDGLSQTVLHYAAIEGDVALVNVLLATGAYVNAKDDRGRTALHFAASKGHLGIVKLLLEQGAEVNAKDDRGRTALHWAADRGHFDVVKLLLAEGADVNAHDNSGYTALHYAAAKGHVDVFNALLAKGADVHAVTDHDETALHLAADFDVVNLLHAKGADANAKDNEGCTALHWAAAKGRFGVVNALLAKGADVNAHDDNGYTALHWAAAKGHVDVVNALLAKGVDVNAKNYKGQVALDLALERRHVDVISALANAALAKVVKEEAMQYLSPLANPQTITELTEVTKLIEAITKDGLAVIYDQIKSRITERMREEFSSLYRDKAADLFTVLIDSGKDTVLEGLSQFQEQLEKSEGYHEDCRQRLRQSGRFFSAQAFSEPSDAYPHGGPADLGAGDRQASEQPSEATHTVGIKREREEEQEQEDFQASERLRTGV